MVTAFLFIIILYTCSIVELDSAYMTLQDQSKATGTTKVLVGTIIGALGLIAMAALVVAAVVIYRMKAPKNYEKLPLLIDE